ncbi:MAG: hypothetical protein ACT4P8_03920 [Betaproteobacteria bacterium]
MRQMSQSNSGAANRRGRATLVLENIAHLVEFIAIEAVALRRHEIGTVARYDYTAATIPNARIRDVSFFF